MLCLADIHERPALFLREKEKRWIGGRAEGRWGGRKAVFSMKTTIIKIKKISILWEYGSKPGGGRSGMES